MFLLSRSYHSRTRILAEVIDYLDAGLDHGISPAPRVITRSIFSHSNCAFSRLLIASEVRNVSECPENKNSMVLKETHLPSAHPTVDAGLAIGRRPTGYGEELAVFHPPL